LGPTMLADGKHPLGEYDDVFSGLTDMSNRLQALDSNRLDILARGAAHLTSHLDQLNAHRLSSPSTEHEEKVSELHAIITHWDRVAQSLPLLVARLVSLKEIHEDNATVLSRINSLERVVSEMTGRLKTNAKTLELASKSLTNNAETMQRNMEMIQERLATLEGGMDPE